MKKIILVVLSVYGLLICGGQNGLQAQMTTSGNNDRQMVKEAGKLSRQLEKEGFATLPNALPAARQLEKSIEKQQLQDQYDHALYFFTVLSATAGNQPDAMGKALELAKNNIAGQIIEEWHALIELNLSKKPEISLGNLDVKASLELVKSSLSDRLGNLIPVVELYRNLPDQGVEVLVHFFYSRAQALNETCPVVRTQILKEVHLSVDEINQVLCQTTK